MCDGWGEVDSGSATDQAGRKTCAKCGHGQPVLECASRAASEGVRVDVRDTALPERYGMTTVEWILEEARSLSESEARALLDFIGYLKYKRVRVSETERGIRDGDEE